MLLTEKYWTKHLLNVETSKRKTNWNTQSHNKRNKQKFHLVHSYFTQNESSDSFNRNKSLRIKIDTQICRIASQYIIIDNNVIETTYTLYGMYHRYYPIM